MAAVLFSPRQDQRHDAAVGMLLDHRRAQRKALRAAVLTRRTISAKPLIEDIDQLVSLFERRRTPRH
jgi:hypothetical protein